jgi:hypothetical protein
MLKNCGLDFSLLKNNGGNMAVEKRAGQLKAVAGRTADVSTLCSRGSGLLAFKHPQNKHHQEQHGMASSDGRGELLSSNPSSPSLTPPPSPPPLFLSPESPLPLLRMKESVMSTPADRSSFNFPSLVFVESVPSLLLFSTPRDVNTPSVPTPSPTSPPPPVTPFSSSPVMTNRPLSSPASSEYLEPFDVFLLEPREFREKSLATSVVSLECRETSLAERGRVVAETTLRQSGSGVLRYSPETSWSSDTADPSRFLCSQFCYYSSSVFRVTNINKNNSQKRVNHIKWLNSTRHL